MKDYYKILGVGETATNDQIKKAFKDIAKKEHPDRGGNEAVFKEANEAHDTLKDSQKRHDYDTQRKFGGSTRQEEDRDSTHSSMRTYSETSSQDSVAETWTSMEDSTSKEIQTCEPRLSDQDHRQIVIYR